MNHPVTQIIFDPEFCVIAVLTYSCLTLCMLFLRERRLRRKTMLVLREAEGEIREARQEARDIQVLTAMARERLETFPWNEMD